MTKKQLEKMGIIYQHDYLNSAKYWINSLQYFIYLPKKLKDITFDTILLEIHGKSIEIGKKYGRQELLNEFKNLFDLE